jgi:predicted NUDIX family NTP pyrophosphohydrolase
MMPHPRTIVGVTDRISAGILLYRRTSGGRLEVLLGHPGGPFHARKDLGDWSIPKGEVDPGEGLYAVARREFEEETGHPPPDAITAFPELDRVAWFEPAEARRRLKEAQGPFVDRLELALRAG